MRRIAIAIALCALGGCAHTKRVEQGQNDRAQPKREETKAAPGRPTVSTAPRGLFDEKTITRVQHALAHKGYEVKASGELDDPTQKALEKFQQKEKLPATGFPDDHTLERLGLSADRAHKHAKGNDDDKRAAEKKKSL